MVNHLFGYITKLTRKKKTHSYVQNSLNALLPNGDQENQHKDEADTLCLTHGDRLQTLNHKSCFTNVVLQNGRNYNYFMGKVQAFGTIRSCPFKALRPPKED
jgi:hypothetical protein